MAICLDFAQKCVTDNVMTQNQIAFNIFGLMFENLNRKIFYLNEYKNINDEVIREFEQEVIKMNSWLIKKTLQHNKTKEIVTNLMETKRRVDIQIDI